MKETIIRLQRKYSMNGEIEINKLFKKPSVQEVEILTDLFKTYSVSNEVYSAEELAIIKDYKVPEKIIKFYKECTPVDAVDIGGDVNLLSLDNIKRENAELIPGAYLIRYGLVTFATSTGGNVICMDLNDLKDEEPSIILVDHSIFSDKKIIFFKNGIMEKYDLEYEIIRKYSLKVSGSFTHFINTLIEGEIEDIEDYLN